MIYKFKSQATGELIMLGPVGDQVLRLIGKDPAATGIITVAAMPAALAAIDAAVAADEAAGRADVPADAAHAGDPGDPGAPSAAVTLRQRAWPFVDMLRRCHAESADIVWGV